MQNRLKEVRAALEGAQRVVVATHITPDGDAVGSAAAIAHILLHLGSEVRLLLYDDLPNFLSWLPLPCPLIRDMDEIWPAASPENAKASPAQSTPKGSEKSAWQPDRLVFVDCADPKRSGPAFARFLSNRAAFHDILSVNIDHHGSNKGFADVNWVEPERAATGELVGLLAEDFGLPLEGDLGMALYLALASDTGNFSFSNTGAESLALASRIVGAGLDVGNFTDKYENNWSLSRMHLWGKLMEEVSLHHGGAVAVCKVPLCYLTENKLTKDALEGFASWLRKIDGVRVGLFLREDAPGLTKMSLRSMGDVNVATVAAQYGGGGHAAAAGAEVADTPDAVAEMVLKALKPQLC